jgi:hypothetical protein
MRSVINTSVLNGDPQHTCRRAVWVKVIGRERVTIIVRSATQRWTHLKVGQPPREAHAPPA